MNRRFRSIFIIVLTALLLLASGCKSAPKTLTLYGINTGKSDCMLFCLPNGETLMVDTGLKDTYERVKAVLNIAKVKRIDHLILTHGHKDHIGGLSQLAEDYTIGTIHTNAYDTATYSKKERTLIESATDSWSNTKPAVWVEDSANYSSVQLGNSRANFLAPPLKNLHIDFIAPFRSYSDEEDDNNNSLVLRLVYENVTFLLMGDATSVIEADLLEKYHAFHDLTAAFLKAGRHGQADANTKEFIDVVSPRAVYITGNRQEDSDSPDTAVLERYDAIGADVFINEGDHLAVVWTSDGQTLSDGEYLN